MRYHLLPQFLQVELTYACNSACTFCYNPHHHRQIDDDLRYRILKEINSYKIRHVQLIGGEITTLPNLARYLECLQDIPWRSAVTNGRIFASAAWTSCTFRCTAHQSFTNISQEPKGPLRL
jgi:MoaA/NifB/PqqE/SkfB family radical SAM enzyme